MLLAISSPAKAGGISRRLINILGIIFFYFGNYFFFLWFQLEVETFQVGVGCLCRGGRPKKKKLVGGWGGGRSASPPDAFAEHAV